MTTTGKIILIFCKYSKSIYYCILFVGICFCIGCAHGPVRHHTLGYYKYASFEFTKRSHLFVKPLALTTGLATDIVLIGVDTAVTPIAALIVPDDVLEVGRDEETRSMLNLMIPTYPFTLANIGAMGLGSGSKDEYEELFGYESSLFHDTPSDDNSVENQKSP
jgi:hypothetical protein